MKTTLLPCLFTAAAAVSLPASANAQCQPSWLPGAPAAGPLGSVRAILALPGGELVVGGNFDVADSTTVHDIARWDGTTWRALGSGSNGTVLCLQRLQNGDVVAGGTFTSMGGQPCSRIARWNGAAWAPIGTGLNGPVFALLGLPNGDLVAAGQFQFAGAGGVTAVAGWNGAVWAPIGTGLLGGPALALALQPNGELVAGGNFSGTALFRWDGVAWSAIAGIDPSPSPRVHALTTLTSGLVAIAGEFAIAGTPRRFAIWNGSTMLPLDPPTGPLPSSSALPSVPLPVLPSALLAAPNGDLIVGASPLDPTSPSLVRWNGSSWTSIAGSPRRIVALAADSAGQLVTGSLSFQASTPPVLSHSVARLQPSGWQGLGASPPPDVRNVIRFRGSEAVVGGSFATFGGATANNLARWDGSGWSALGTGVDGAVDALATAPNGDLIVGGSFQQAGGSPARRIARWNGSVWSALGNGLDAPPLSLVVAANGNIFAATADQALLRFDGAQWSTLQPPGWFTGDGGLAALPNGDVVVASVVDVDLELHTYRPTTGAFTLLPAAPPWIRHMTVDAAGTLFTAGAAGVHRWDGTNWTQLLSGFAERLTFLPNGDLLVLGAPQVFGGSSIPTTVYRLGATSWSSFADLAGAVTALATTDRGDVFASGVTSVEGGVALGLAQAVASCPATVLVVGTGCAGAAGPVTLQAQNRAWVGGSLRTTTTGLATNAPAWQLVSLQPTTLPLPSGPVGCSLFGVPLFGEVLPPSPGVVNGIFAVPPQPSLAGLVFRLQVVGFDVWAAGVVGLTSSNGLELTIGLL